MTAPVGGAVKAAVAAAAPAAAPIADGAATAAAATGGAVGGAGAAGAAAPGITKTGWFGLSAGAAGIAITLMDAWKSSLGSQQGFDAGSVFGPTTFTIGGGAAMLLLGERAGIPNSLMRNGLRGGGVALVLGGLAGALTGAARTFGGQDVLPATTQRQLPTPYAQALPPAPANLDGIEVATGEVIGANRSMQRVPVYVDPATATALPAGTEIADAVAQARAATQADAEDRSHAVVKTADEQLWIMRLAGSLDQVDGRNYATGTNYDARYAPQVSKRQETLQAIAGVEELYVFPAGLGADEAPQEPGEIPWLTPELSKPATPTGG